MKKDKNAYIKLEKEYINKYMFNIKVDVEGRREDIKNMTVSLLSDILENDKELVVEILMKFMEDLEKCQK